MSYLGDKIITIREATGLDISLLDDGEMILYGAQLKIQGKKVKKVKATGRIQTFGQLQKAVDSSIPLAISINGKGVLMRPVAEETDEHIINQLFPGSNPQDFYATIHSYGEPEQRMAYITRRSVVDEILTKLKQKGFKVLSLSIGTGSLDLTLPFLSKGTVLIDTPVLQTAVINQQITAITAKDNGSKTVYPEVQVGGEGYHSGEVPAAGNALGILYKPADRVTTDITNLAIESEQKDYAYYKRFRFTGWTMLLTTLGLLLINFFVFNHYFGKNQELRQRADLSGLQSEQTKMLAMQTDSLYSFFLQSGWNKPTKHGFYVDRIAALCPATVKFTVLESAPLLETTRTGEMTFENDKIRISGLSSDPSDLETFTRAIKNVDGVAGASLKNYQYKRETGASEFLIEVTLQK